MDEVLPYKRHVVERNEKPTHKFECASCGYTHTDRRVGSNHWHSECLEMHKREFHSVPDRLIKLSTLRLSKP